jgi:hypothetical protein
LFNIENTDLSKQILLQNITNNGAIHFPHNPETSKDEHLDFLPPAPRPLLFHLKDIPRVDTKLQEIELDMELSMSWVDSWPRLNGPLLTQ